MQIPKKISEQEIIPSKQSLQNSQSFQQFQTDIRIQDDILNVANLQNGPFQQQKRQCKDIFWFIFYWLNTGATIILSTWALFVGQPKNIFRATDSYGNICGIQKTPLQKYRYSYFYNPTNFGLSNRVCVEECPKFKQGMYNLTQLKCYQSGPSCSINISISKQGVSNLSIVTNGNYFIGYESKQRIDRICLPQKNVLQGALKPYSNSMANDLIQSTLMDFISDVQNNYQWLFVMCSVGILFSIIFWLGFFFIKKQIIWISLLLCFILFITIGIVFLYNGGSLTKTDQQGRLGIPTSVDRNFYRIYGGFTLFFSLLVFLMILCCYYQMYPLFQMISIANRFIKQYPWTMCIVIQMTIMMSLFWITSVNSIIYAFSAAQFKAQGKVFTQIVADYDRGIIMFIYFVINSLWGHQVFITTMTFGISMMFSMWYFSDGPQKMNKPLKRTLQMIMRYHFGSLTFGSLILLFVQFLQYIMEMLFFVHEWKYRNKNAVFRCIDYFSNCTYRFFSNITSRFNRFAYIQIALRGKNFMQASKDGYLLIQYNRKSYGLLYGLNSVVSFVIKVSIALIPTTLFYLFASFWNYAETNILEPIYFVLIIFYYSLGVASVIIGTYTAIIDTLITCYVIDQINQKRYSLKPKHAPEDIQKLFQLINN